jgi:hypothetical protein
VRAFLPARRCIIPTPAWYLASNRAPLELDDTLDAASREATSEYSPGRKSGVIDQIEPESRRDDRKQPGAQPVCSLRKRWMLAGRAEPDANTFVF